MADAQRRPIAGVRFPEMVRFTEPRRSFGLVLVAIVIAVIFQLAAPDTDPARLIGIVIQGAVVVLALRAAGARRHMVVIAATACAVVAVLAAIALLGIGTVGPAAPRILTLILVMLTPLAVIVGVVRELREDRRVTFETIYAGLCLYLLLGTAFALLFGAVEDVGEQPFFAAGVPGTSNDFLYFSFATLTTTGYGDFSAATELGRAFAVTEALIGQMYLVTVLAVIVSNLGSVGRRP